MHAIEKAIRETVPRFAALRTTALDRAVSAYEARLPHHEVPGETDLVTAAGDARSTLLNSLLEPSTLSLAGVDTDRTAPAQTIRIALQATLPDLEIPPPAAADELPGSRLALAGAVGAIGGVLILGPWLRLALGDMSAVAWAGPLGIFIVVGAVWHTSRSAWFRRALMALLGIGAAADIWLTLRGPGFFGQAWSLVRGRSQNSGCLHLVKRLVTYAAVFGLLVLARRIPAYDRSGHLRIVRNALGSWLDGGLRLLTALATGMSERGAGEPAENADQLLAELGRHLYTLHRTPAEGLDSAAADLIQDARNLGFEGLEPGVVGPLREFEWAESLRDQYETFGRIEAGMTVLEERPPVVFRGRTLGPGRVRKSRGSK